jgi:hypothetical protein
MLGVGFGAAVSDVLLVQQVDQNRADDLGVGEEIIILGEEIKR